MENFKNIANQQVSLSWLQFFFILASAISATFTVTNVYKEFELQRDHIDKLNIKIETIDKYHYDRVTKLTKRNKEEIDKLKNQ